LALMVVIRSLKLAIDAYNIALEHGTGVATYGRNLVSAVAKLGHDVGVLFGATARHSKVALLNEIALAEGDPMARINSSKAEQTMVALGAFHNALRPRLAREVPLSGQVILPISLRLSGKRSWNVRNLYASSIVLFRGTGAFTKVRVENVEVAHWTYPLPIEAIGAVNVYTLHDLVPLRLPYTTADHKRAYYKLCKSICDRADHILTVSECSRRDIIEIFGMDERRVTNLYQSSDVATILEGMPEEEIARYIEGLLGVGIRQYFLFFGAIEPKKNVARMLEAYLGSASNTPLVIVGAPGWGSEKDIKLLKSIATLDSKKRIIWLGYLPREMLVMLIAGARATLFPSLYEGFGLPVLESMSLGTPVITSNTSSLPEVAGDAGLLVDPYDVRSIAKAIMTMDRDEDLRTGLAARGREQAARFSTEIYQQRLCSFYNGM
jgi:glycosyltransferase involved in cell wall biosynthesis